MRAPARALRDRAARKAAARGVVTMFHPNPEPTMNSPDSFRSRSTLKVGAKSFTIWKLDALKAHGDPGRLPFSLRVMLENLLRTEDGVAVTKDDVLALLKWNPKAEPDREMAFTPARVLLQDFTGVPAVVDLAAMREAFRKMGEIGRAHV